MSNEQILQRATSDFLQQATSATSNEWISTTSNERILQPVTSDFLQRVKSDFLQRSTSATSNDRIFQRVTIDFTTSNEQRVKSYASIYIIIF